MPTGPTPEPIPEPIGDPLPPKPETKSKPEPKPPPVPQATTPDLEPQSGEIPDAKKVVEPIQSHPDPEPVFPQGIE